MACIFDVSAPITPPLMIVTRAAGVPGTPPNKSSAPTYALCKQRAVACTLILLATSLIGFRSCRVSLSNSAISYATEAIFSSNNTYMVLPLF